MAVDDTMMFTSQCAFVTGKSRPCLRIMIKVTTSLGG